MRWILAVMLVTSSLWARTLHVPTVSFPTVQAGLDSLQNGDTVSVAIGTYPESLSAPMLAFVLRGDVVHDTGDYPRPIIDPTREPNSDQLACLYLPSGSAPVIEDFVFRNGAAMYPHSTLVGGVSAGGPLVTFRRCIFDSTYCGVFGTDTCTVELDECHFLNVWKPITDLWYPLAVRASDCLFTGTTGGTPITAIGGCDLLRCQFGCTPSGYQCSAGGSLWIRDCQFGPCEQDIGYNFNSSILLSSRPHGVIEDNVFTGINLRGFCIIQAACQCNDTFRLEIRRNVFENDSGQSSGECPGIALQCEGNGTGYSGTVIDSNVFAWNHSDEAPVFRSIGFDYASGSAAGNLFADLNWEYALPPLGPPPVLLSLRAPSSTLRSNRFEGTGTAVVDSSSVNSDTMDARWNWWSDSTGPYNMETNPSGQGDSIIGHRVIFAPWCSDSIICEEPNASKSHSLDARPSSHCLSVHPNPFNSTSILHLEVPQPEIVRVELFDVLGRRVKELWSGAVAEEKEVALDGSALSSGVYFVRMTNTIWNRPLITTKIVLLK